MSKSKMSRPRSAAATIAGYLYQFDKTIIQLLGADENQEISIEGIEDIDIESPNEIKNAIQVKYHAGKDYNLSAIAKPVRQMLQHFKRVQQGEEYATKYTLYAHFRSNTDNLKVDGNGKLIPQSENETTLDFLKKELLTTSSKKKCKKEYWKADPNLDDDIELDDNQLNEFIEQLSINIKAKNIEEQLETVLTTLVEKIDNCRDTKEAEEFYYNNALKVVFHKAKERDSEGIKLEDEGLEIQKQIRSAKDKIERREKNIEKLENEITTAEKEKLSLDDSEKQKISDKITEIEGFQKEVQELTKELKEKRKEAHKLHVSKRKITKKDFLAQIDKKAFLFNKWYAWHKGKEKYIEYVVGKLKGENSLTRSKNKYLFIDKSFLAKSRDADILDLIENIISSSFSLENALATKDKVWSIILDCESSKIAEIKGQALEKGYKFNDGGETYNKFNYNRFITDPIINADKNLIIEKAEFQVRLIRHQTFKEHFVELEKKIDVLLYFSPDDFTSKVGKVNSNLRLYVIEPSKGLDNIISINQIFNTRKIQNDYFRIVTVSPNLLQVEVTKPNKFKHKNEKFTLGSYVKISDEFEVSILGILKNYKIKDVNEEHNKVNLLKKEPSFLLDIQPVGYIKGDEFKKGGNTITIPPSEVEIVDSQLLKKMFTHKKSERAFSFGIIPQSISSSKEDIRVELDGDKFFNKHLAVVGSTGSGKSCTVAKILQEGIKKNDNQINRGALNRSKVLLFDLHGEYFNAFQPDCRKLTVNDLQLPYWLMNSEELESFLIDTEGSDHNQKNILKKAVTWNKKIKNKNEDGSYNEKITYDSPVYFNIKEVLQAIKNFNIAKEKDNKIVFLDESGKDVEISEEINEDIFKKLEQHNAKQARSFHGKFIGFISRLENKIYDDRYKFILNQGKEYNILLIDIVKQIIGYEVNDRDLPDSNVIIVDLSGIPYEIVSITVAIISRLIFNFAFHWKRVNIESDIETPFLIVYEEAHNYIPKMGEAKYKTVRQAVERIAKEGRKYGVSAMIVSQRPSEISETIFSQCNSFVVMRLTNPHDQQYIKKLLPEDINSVTDSLSIFEQRQALVLGDAMPIPAIIEVDKLNSNKLPKSNDVNFIQTWRKDWYEMDEFDKIIDSMNK